MTDQTHVLLWSQSQCAMHIESVHEMLQTNATALVQDRRMDYVPIVFGTSEACHDAADRVRATLRERQERKVA